MVRVLMFLVNLSARTVSQKSITRPRLVVKVARTNSRTTSHQKVPGNAVWCPRLTRASMMNLVTARRATGTTETNSRVITLASTTPGAQVQTILKIGGTLRRAARRSRHFGAGAGSSWGLVLLMDWAAALISPTCRMRSRRPWKARGLPCKKLRSSSNGTGYAELYPGSTAIFARFRNFYPVMELAVLALSCGPSTQTLACAARGVNCERAEERGPVQSCEGLMGLAS